MTDKALAEKDSPFSIFQRVFWKTKASKAA